LQKMALKKPEEKFIFQNAKLNDSYKRRMYIGEVYKL
jgi:hypothetical protein